MTGFGDRVIQAIAARGPVCVGLDPRESLLPPDVIASVEDAPDPTTATARAFAEFCRQVIDAVAPHASAVKPQAAFFEQLLSPGFAAFEQVCRYARQRGLIVVGDVKRGDIGTTAAAYAHAYLEPVAGQPPLTDACTVNPWLGTDGVQPFVEAGMRHGGGAFVLVKTSNPSSGELQDLSIQDETVSERVAGLVERWNAPHLGTSGYGPLGAVVGATYPEHLGSLRRQLSTAVLLVPGYGAQGGGAKDVVGAFDDGGTGALITASRSVTFPWAKEGACPANWRERISDAAAEMRDDIAQVLAGGS